MQRRSFLGLAAAGTAGLVLRSDALPTPRSHDAALAEEMFAASLPDDTNTKDLKPTVSRDLGPFYRSGAPYRAKMTPPFEPGTVLIVAGRVWSFATKKPIAGASLDLWQVDNQTKDYSNGNGDFKNRARLVTDETERTSLRPSIRFPTIRARIFDGRRTSTSLRALAAINVL